MDTPPKPYSDPWIWSLAFPVRQEGDEDSCMLHPAPALLFYPTKQGPERELQL